MLRISNKITVRKTEILGVFTAVAVDEKRDVRSIALIEHSLKRQFCHMVIISIMQCTIIGAYSLSNFEIRRSLMSHALDCVF